MQAAGGRIDARTVEPVPQVAKREQQSKRDI
jgi:hypothetical protein